MAEGPGGQAVGAGMGVQGAEGGRQGPFGHLGVGEEGVEGHQASLHQEGEAAGAEGVGLWDPREGVEVEAAAAEHQVLLNPPAEGEGEEEGVEGQAPLTALMQPAAELACLPNGT